MPTVTQDLPFVQIPAWIVLSPHLTASDIRVYAVIATHAGRDRTAFPGIRLIAKETGCAKSTVEKSIGNLESAGALLIDRKVSGSGRRLANHYHLPLQPPQGVPTNGTGVPTGRTGGVPTDGTELYPEITISNEPQEHARNPIFDAISEACGYTNSDLTPALAKTIGIAASQLKAINPTREEIIRRARIYEINQPGKLTPLALAKWWADCDRPKLKPSARQIRDAARRQELAEVLAGLE